MTHHLPAVKVVGGEPALIWVLCHTVVNRPAVKWPIRITSGTRILKVPRILEGTRRDEGLPVIVGGADTEWLDSGGALR